MHPRISLEPSPSNANSKALLSKNEAELFLALLSFAWDKNKYYERGQKYYIN
jgi:hypothetical protein